MPKWIIVCTLVATVAYTAPPPQALPQFPDRDRKAKLSTAFADIDALFAEFAKSAHVPGAAWGIVIDGELAHSGSAGVRDVVSGAPVDADTVFRIASMTKSFTAMAILKLRDEGKLSLDDPAERYVPELKGLRYPTTDSPRITIRHLLSHSAGFPEDNPWGDQQLADTEEQLSHMMQEGIPFSNAPGTGVRILELRVCHSRTDRLEGVREGVRRLHLTEHPPAARHDVHDAAPVGGGSQPPRCWISVGRRTVERGTAAAAWFVRLDGRHADVDSRSEQIRFGFPRRVAAARWAGARTDSAGRPCARCSRRGVHRRPGSRAIHRPAPCSSRRAVTRSD